MLQVRKDDLYPEDTVKEKIAEPEPLGRLLGVGGSGE